MSAYDALRALIFSVWVYIDAIIPPSLFLSFFSPSCARVRNEGTIFRAAGRNHPWGRLFARVVHRSSSSDGTGMGEMEEGENLPPPSGDDGRTAAAAIK